MPIIVERHGKKWVVINKATGKIHGSHPTQRKARAQWFAMKNKGVDMSGKGE